MKRRLSKTLESVGRNFLVRVQVTDVVAYLHFENNSSGKMFDFSFPKYFHSYTQKQCKIVADILYMRGLVSFH